MPFGFRPVGRGCSAQPDLELGEDLLDVWDDIADDNEAAADGMLDRIDRVWVVLDDNPGAGRTRHQLADYLRSFPVGNSVVVDLPARDGIEVVRVPSGYRDIGPDAFDA